VDVPADQLVVQQRERGAVAAPRSRVLAALSTWPVAVAACLGVATAFYRLGDRGLWGDEVWQAAWAQQQPLAQTFLRFRQPPDLPLSFLLTQLATGVSGDPFWVRLPSAVLGAATIVLLFALGRRVFGTATGLAAALLLAVAPYHVWYAQDARPYAALACYALLSLYFFYRVLERPTLGVAAGFAIATALDLYNHLFGLFPLLVEGVAAVAWVGYRQIRARRDAAATGQRERRALALLAGATVAALLAAIPLFDGVRGYLLNAGPGDGGAAAFHLDVASLLDLLGLFGAGGGWALLLVLALFVAGVVAGLTRRRPFPLLALAWIGLPFGLLWVLHPHHDFIPRYFLFMQPVYLLLVAYGLVRIAYAAVRALPQSVISPPPTGAAPRTGLAARSDAAQRVGNGGALLAGLLTLALGAVVFAPTRYSYGVEKVNDWSAICGYLRRNVALGDVVTGNTYIQGIMDWCFKGTTGVSITPPGAYSLPQLAATGRNVWYILVGSDTPDAAYVRRTYAAVPRRAWADPRYVAASNYDGRFAFPQAEYPAVLYHAAATRVPSRLAFHDVHGATINPAWPDYAQLGPGGRAYMRLRLPATRPRVLRIVMLDLVGRDLNVRVDNRLAAAVKPRATSLSWRPVDIAVPKSAGDTFLLEIDNPASSISAYSTVAVTYVNGKR